MGRILVVDDKPHLTYVVSSWLRQHGHEAVCADDGQAALELLRTQSFDVLVTDVDMPRMDGLTLIAHHDVIKKLRAVIVLTGRTDYEGLLTSPQPSNVHLLPKPFSPTRFVQFVQGLLDAHLSTDAALERCSCG